MLDIPGLVEEQPSAGVGLVILVSLWQATAHESRGVSGVVAVSLLVLGWKSVFMYDLSE